MTGPPIAGWFDQRVRPLIGAEGLTGTWQGPAERLGAADLELVARRLGSRDALPARAALTMLAGWTAGFVAWVIAIGVVRERVLGPARCGCCATRTATTSTPDSRGRA
jgi:hypothetical protein